MAPRSDGQRLARQERRRRAAVESRALLTRFAEADPLADLRTVAGALACPHCGYVWPYGVAGPPAAEHAPRCLWRQTVEWLAANKANL